MNTLLSFSEVNDRRLPTDVVASPTLVERHAPANQRPPPRCWNTATSSPDSAEAHLDRQGRIALLLPRNGQMVVGGC